MDKNLTSARIARAPRITVDESSPEARDLDSSLFRIAPSGRVLPEFDPLLSGFDSQFSQVYTSEDKGEDGTVLNEPGDIVELDEIEKISGPTAYFQGNNKKFKIVMRITNSKGLDVKSVNIRKSVV